MLGFEENTFWTAVARSKKTMFANRDNSCCLYVQLAVLCVFISQYCNKVSLSVWVKLRWGQKRSQSQTGPEPPLSPFGAANGCEELKNCNVAFTVELAVNWCNR